MSPDAHASRARPSLAEAWLFWATLMLAGFLAIYTPYKFGLEALKRAEVDHFDLVAFGFIVIATLAGLTGLRWCVLFVFSYATLARGAREPMPPPGAPLPFLSILVPAYREADCIRDALDGLTRLNYPSYEVIVVDDGSDDGTYELALPFAGKHVHASGSCEVQVWRKPNGGKWSAHNFAFRRAQGTLILCIDADSRIEPNALLLMVRHMRDRRVGGVSGQIRVRNRTSLLMYFQALEYVLANGALRLSQGALRAVTIVPGPIGMFRREVMSAVQAAFESDANAPRAIAGPFSHRTFAEDFNLSLAVLTLGFQIAYEPLAIAHTKAPSTLPSLMSQRYRWNRGTMQVLSWYIGQAIRGGKQRTSVNVWIAVAFLVDYYVIPIIYFFVLGGMIGFLLYGGSLANLAAWAAAVWLTNIMSGSLYVIAHRDKFTLLALVPAFELYQGVLLSSAWLISAYDQLRGARMRW